MCILRLCAHNESCKRVYYKNVFVWKMWKYDNVYSDSVYPEAKNSFLLRFYQLFRENSRQLWNESIMFGIGHKYKRKQEVKNHKVHKRTSNVIDSHGKI